MKTSQKPKARRAVNFGTTYNIPLTAATQIRQSANDTSVTRINGTDRIGSLSFGPNTPLGVPSFFRMAPTELTGTRLSKLAQNYQLYRFTAMELTVFSNQPTASGGAFTAAYTENADQAFTTGSVLSTQVFALPGAVMGNMFLPTTIQARIQDKNRWYKIDNDSAEVMNTVQGVFIVAVDSAAATNVALNVPILLKWSVEFKGSASQVGPSVSPVAIFPACNYAPAGPEMFTLTPIAGEPLGPVMLASVPYAINPGIQILGEDVEIVAYYSASGPGNTGFKFYLTLEEFETGKAIQTSNAGTPPFSFGRTTVQPLN